MRTYVSASTCTMLDKINNTSKIVIFLTDYEIERKYLTYPLQHAEVHNASIIFLNGSYEDK